MSFQVAGTRVHGILPRTSTIVPLVELWCEEGSCRGTYHKVVPVLHKHVPVEEQRDDCTGGISKKNASSNYSQSLCSNCSPM